MEKNLRLDLVWAFLIGATVLTWYIGERGAGGMTIVFGLIVISAIKGGLVILDFMALREVRLFWRALVLGIIALAYRMGIQ